MKRHKVTKQNKIDGKLSVFVFFFQFLNKQRQKININVLSAIYLKMTLCVDVDRVYI